MLNLIKIAPLMSLFSVKSVKSVFVRTAIAFALVFVSAIASAAPARAETSDRYIREFLQAKEPVPVQVNPSGETRLFSPDDLYEGKRLFMDHCINCHVGGSTLPSPTISLSEEALHGATPPRDNLDSLIAYMREPMSYDGSEPIYWCREVTERWMPQETIEKLAAFILRAANVAPGWGSDNFDL